MEDYGPETFGKLNAEFYDVSYDNPSEAATLETVEVLAELARRGTVLELAIGTGRVALPLAARGLPVHGIDASPEMIAKLRQKPGGEAIPVSIGNFADVAVEGAFDLVFLVFNTLFNLTTQSEQVQCFQNVAKHLTPHGVFVIEAFVPDVARFTGDQRVRVVHIAIDSVVLEASMHDPVTQTVRYQYLTTTRDGTRLSPLPMRYAWPSEIDLMARLAGLELRERWSGWDRARFKASSSKHVSVYGQVGE
jgi:SAM-dependent methyltransferase